MIDPNKRIHFVGIGGVGMSALAEVLLARGMRVSGSDLHASETTRRLAERGATISIGHDVGHISSAEVIVTSRAIRETNVELVAARSRGIPIYHRAELLAQVLAERTSIAVVGTHGKTTTAALTAHVLAAGGYDPLALIGAEVADFGGNLRLGQGRYAVAEVDESDGSLVYVRPAAAVITSLDLTDHRDHYQTQERLLQTFASFIGTIPPSGFLALAVDHPNVRQLRTAVAARVITYALEGEADYAATIQRFDGPTTHWTLHHRGGRVRDVMLPLPGRYNVANALAATAVAHVVGMSFERIADALASFHGVSRRFAVRADIDGIMVVDDYAHNPTKIAAVLRAAKESWPHRRLIAVFQPHRFTRTQSMFHRFATAFHDADELIITPIYAADEAPILGVSAALIVEAVREHQPVTFIDRADRVTDYLLPRLRRGDLILTLGAGDIWEVADAIGAALRSQRSAPESPKFSQRRNVSG